MESSTFGFFFFGGSPPSTPLAFSLEIFLAGSPLPDDFLFSRAARISASPLASDAAPESVESESLGEPASEDEASKSSSGQFKSAGIIKYRVGE
jgi:hypothetical protein